MTQAIDLMPTFLDFHGCNLPPHVQGHSLRRVLEGETVRQDGIFSWFGRALNITDGRHVYRRNPVNAADGGPLHAYTAMPVGGLNSWVARELLPQIETVRQFSHTYGLPLYKIPARGTAPRGEPTLIGRHQLFDLQSDPHQQHPLDDPSLEAHFCQRLRAHLEKCEAELEHYERLGLDGLEQGAKS